MGNENSPSLSNTQKRTLKLQVLISIVKRTLRKYRSGLSVSTCLGGTNKKIPTRGRERDDKKGDKWRHREHTKFKRAPFQCIRTHYDKDDTPPFPMELDFAMPEGPSWIWSYCPLSCTKSWPGELNFVENVDDRGKLSCIQQVLLRTTTTHRQRAKRQKPER